jgi:pyruvate, water dikinase
LLNAARRCFASLFTDRAISYREAKGFEHLKLVLSIGVQQMVRSDLASAGVMFSIDTETGFRLRPALFLFRNITITGPAVGRAW